MCSSHGERRVSLEPLRVWTAEAPEEPRPRKIRWFVAALVVSEGFEGPHCSCTAMADLLVQVSRVVTDYWANDFEARRLTVRGRCGRFRGIRRSLAHASHQGGSTGAGFGTQLLSRRTKRRNNLSTLAEDAMLSTPDQLDRLSRRSDAARHGGGPASKKASRGPGQQRTLAMV